MKIRLLLVLLALLAGARISISADNQTGAQKGVGFITDPIYFYCTYQGIDYTLSKQSDTNYTGTITANNSTAQNVSVPTEFDFTGTGYDYMGGSHAISGHCKVIAVRSMKNNTFVKTISLPSSVTFIDEEAFSGCTSLTKVTFPSGITTIPEYCFEGCTSLTTFNFNGFKSIGNGAFTNSGIKQVNLPSAISSVGSRAFFGCTSLTSVTLPLNMTSISDYLFANCSTLKSIKFPMALQSIGSNAFAGTALTDITLPRNVTSVKDKAFWCELEKVTVMRGEPSKYNCSTTAFNSSTYQNATLYVPYGKKNIYSTTLPWSKFQHIEYIGHHSFVFECLSPGGKDFLENVPDDVSANVTDNVYINLNVANGDGFETATHTCTLNTLTNLDALGDLNDVDVEDEDFANNFFGFHFIIPAGSGTINLSATVTGGVTLWVKIGDNAPVGITSQEGNKSIPYDVDEPTPVFVYLTASGSSLAAPSTSPILAAAASGAIISKFVWKEEGHADTTRGDVSGDGQVNGSDVTALYNVLLDGAAPAGNADVNGDGSVNGADVTVLYNLLLDR